MDYGARFNSDVHGLGKYDSAADPLRLRAADRHHPGRVRVAPTPGCATTSLLWDYSNAAGCSTGGRRARSATAATTVAAVPGVRRPVDGRVQEARDQRRQRQRVPGAAVQVLRRRIRGQLDCKTWDRGANQREIIANVTNQFRNYYVFNAYKRGRTTWEIDNYLIRLEERYFNRYSQAFQFFFFSRTSSTSTSAPTCSWRRSIR